MPTVEKNKDIWDGSYDWSKGGEEWSHGWNGSESQWFFCIYPRVHAFLPAANIVEIAPGFGRWTGYLIKQCESYQGFDLAQKCVDACRARFSGERKAQFNVTDGMSLPGVKDKSVDLLFSFDSLVHVELEVIEGYLKEAARVLKPDGVVFFHHSNAWEWREIFAATDKALEGISVHPSLLPQEVKNHLMKSNLCGLSVSHEKVQQAALNVGLRCRSQELIDWNNPLPQNCLSLICRQGSKWDRPTKVYRHTDFMREMRHISMLAPLWSLDYMNEKA
jgi:SAM-dependent methyltransferase